MELGARPRSGRHWAHAPDLAQSRADARRRSLASYDARDRARRVCDDPQDAPGHQATRRGDRHTPKGEPHDPPTRSHARDPPRTPARTAGRRADSSRRGQPDARHHGALRPQALVALADPDGGRSSWMVQLRHAGQRREGTAPSASSRGYSIRASALCFLHCPDAGTASFSWKTSRRIGLCWAGRLPMANWSSRGRSCSSRSTRTRRD